MQEHIYRAQESDSKQRNQQQQKHNSSSQSSRVSTSINVEQHQHQQQQQQQQRDRQQLQVLQSKIVTPTKTAQYELLAGIVEISCLNCHKFQINRRRILI